MDTKYLRMYWTDFHQIFRIATYTVLGEVDN